MSTQKCHLQCIIPSNGFSFLSVCFPLLSTVSKYPPKSFAGRADPFLLPTEGCPGSRTARRSHSRDKWYNDSSLMCQGSKEAAATLNARIILHHLKLSQHITLKAAARWRSDPGLNGRVLGERTNCSLFSHVSHFSQHQAFQAQLMSSSLFLLLGWVFLIFKDGIFKGTRSLARDEAGEGREGSVGVTTHQKVHQTPEDSLGIRQLTSRNAGSGVMASRAWISSISFLSFTAIVSGNFSGSAVRQGGCEHGDLLCPFSKIRMQDGHFPVVGKRKKVLLAKTTSPLPRAVFEWTAKRPKLELRFKSKNNFLRSEEKWEDSLQTELSKWQPRLCSRAGKR